MTPKAEYYRWINWPDLDSAMRDDLVSIGDCCEDINDRFWRHLEFGTGGLRGIIGAGTNRMNIYTVRRATQGLSEYLNSADSTPSVCIAYDTRNMSREFALTAARVFCANAIHVYLFEDVRPTPMLSYAVRYMKATAGVVITASHNPREYNGYKVYGSDGGQITDAAAAAILSCIEQCDVLHGAKWLTDEQVAATGHLEKIGEEVDASYYQKVEDLVVNKNLVHENAASVHILYSPLHGTGNIPIRRVLRQLGFIHVDVVAEQEQPDGDFPTVSYPNPEEPAVFASAIAQAEKTLPDLIFATDPDCDRIGVLVKGGEDSFTVLSGNQVGALLCDYLIRATRSANALPCNAAVIKTIVTTELVKKICDINGVHLTDTLTGFKYIGEKIGQWENTEEHDFLFAFEESYGYLAGDFVRDKDAIIAAVLISEMTLHYKMQGLSLLLALHKLYERYGYADEKLLSYTMYGQQGNQQIGEIMESLRADHSALFCEYPPTIVEDFLSLTRIDCRTQESSPIDLPQSNVLKFIFADSSWLALRPSGTEPKIKAYIGACGTSRLAVENRLFDLESLVKTIIQ